MTTTLHIVPSRLHKATLRAAQMGGASHLSAFGHHILTIAEFEEALLNAFVPATRLMTSLDAWAWCWRWTQHTGQHPSSLLSALAEFQRRNYSLDALNTVVHNITGPRQQRLQTFYESVVAFETWIEQNALVSKERVAYRVAQAIEATHVMPSFISDVSRIEIAMDATSAQAHFILLNAMAKRFSPKIEIVVNLALAPHDARPRGSGSRFLEWLERYETQTPITFLPAIHSAPKLTWTSHATPVQEYECVAGLIRMYAASGIPASRICIAARRPERHRYLVEVLEQTGIPCADHTEHRLTEAMVTRWFLALVAWLAGERNQHATIELLGHPLFTEFFQTFGATVKSVQACARSMWFRSADDEDWHARVKQRALTDATWDQFVKCVFELRELGNRFLRALDTGNAYELLHDLLETWKVAHVLESLTINQPPSPHSQLNQLGLEKLTALLATLARDSSSSPKGFSVNPRTFTRHMHALLAMESVTLGATHSGVSWTGLDNVGSGSWDVLFLVGMAQGEIPLLEGGNSSMSSDDFVLLNEATSRFSDDTTLQPPFIPQVSFQEREADLFWNAISTSKECVLSFTNQDSRGAPIAPTPFIEQLGAAPFLDKINTAWGLDRVRQVAVFRMMGIPKGTHIDDWATVSSNLSIDPLGTNDPLGLPDVAMRATLERERLALILRGYTTDIGDHSGRVSPEWTSHFATTNKPASVTEIDHFAQCAFRGFARIFLGLRDKHDPDSEPEKRTLGTWAHAAFRDIVEVLKGRGLLPWSLNHKSEGVASAREVLANLSRDLHFDAQEHVIASIALEHMCSQLVALIGYLYDSDDRFMPTNTEQGFGPGLSWLPLVIEDAVFHGRIDLVEKQGSTVRVTDLKSSGLKFLTDQLKEDQMGKVHFQLPVYAEVSKRAYQSESALVRYLSLKDSAATKTTSIGDIQTDWHQHLTAFVSQVRSGRFPVAPKKDACVYCGLEGVCRIPRFFAATSS